MLIFLDTEYTAFVAPHLISLAMITEDGRNELYVERSDYPADGCSRFVRDEVLPLLDRPSGERLTYPRLQDRVARFIDELPSQVQIACDDARDELLLRYVFKDGLPPNVAPVTYDLRPIMDSRAFRSSQRAYHERPGCPWHHALHDVRALRLGWLAWCEQH